MDNTKLKSRMNGKVQELQQPQPKTAETAAPDTALAPVDSTYIAPTNNALDIIRANLKSQPLSLDLFDLVKSPSGGSTVFEVPGLSGDEAAKELVGIVLDYTTPRAYWDTPDPVEGTPPVCLSQTASFPKMAKPVHTVLSTPLAQKMGIATPRRVRNRCCCSSYGPTTSSLC